VPITVTSRASRSAAAGSRGGPPFAFAAISASTSRLNPNRSRSIRGYRGPMRVRYASSHPAAICLAVSSSGPTASGTLAATRVALGASARASPSVSSARPSESRDRAQRKGIQSSASSPARRIEDGASAASRIATY
jgi:hypothetical protein